MISATNLKNEQCYSSAGAQFISTVQKTVRSNNLERTPDTDSFKKTKRKKIVKAIGWTIMGGIGLTAVDVIAFKGKYIGNKFVKLYHKFGDILDVALDVIVGIL